MSSEESEDIFDTPTDAHDQTLNIKDFAGLANEIIYNEKIRDGTGVCFRMFLSIMAEDIRNKTLNKDYPELQVIAKYIGLLKNANKFDPLKFLNGLLDTFLNIPLEIVWWLHKAEIVYFLYYCDILKPIDLAKSILNLLKENRMQNIFIPQQIAQDLITELLRGCYRPRVGICRMYRSKDWSVYCSQTLNLMIGNTLQAVFSGNSDSFVNFLPLVQKSWIFLPGIIIKRFYKSILNKMITCKADEFDLFTAYTYQELWNSENINDKLCSLYDEIFLSYCDMQDILDIITEHGDDINWKYTLAAVSICVKNSKTGSTDAKGATLNYLNASFTGGKIKQLLKGLLLIRQSCMEKTMKMTYQTWYSNTFGMQSNYQTTKNVTLFKFVMSSLTALIPCEPKAYLKIHIEQGLHAPPKYNYLIHDYKHLCRARLEELQQSPSVFVNGVEIKVLHMIEESCRNECPSVMMLDVMKHQYAHYIHIIVPQILKKKMPNTKAKDILRKEKYLSDEIISASRVDVDGIIFDNDDGDDFE